MTDAYEAVIWTFYLQMVSYHFREMWAFKVHLNIAFSNFDPFSNRTDQST